MYREMTRRPSDITRRQNAIKRYTQNPNHCQHCGELIKLDLNRKDAFSAVKRKFCDRSCAASYNNRFYPKRVAQKEGPCKLCGEKLIFKKSPTGRYSSRKYCDNCRQRIRHENGQAHSSRLPRFGFELLTKGEVRERTKDSQRMRIYITKHARMVYQKTGRAYSCLACGYTLHVDICHIKDIKDFDDTVKISEINSPDNLITLCPTHHWEFDHGHWKLIK